MYHKNKVFKYKCYKYYQGFYLANVIKPSQNMVKYG